MIDKDDTDDHTLDLFSQPVAIIARSADPETSREAAAAFTQKAAQRSVQTVVNMLRVSSPLTDFQIRQLWPDFWEGPFSYTLPCKARHWARQAGLVRHEGFGSHNNRRVRTWALGADTEFLAATITAKECPHCGYPIP